MFYVAQGWGRYVTWPVTIAAYTSSIYYLAIKSLPLLEAVFPSFYRFAMFAVFSIVLTSGILGWMHYKKVLSGFFKAEVDIQIEANPYSMTIVAPVSLPWMRVLSDLGKLHGIDTTDVDKIVSDTERKFGIKQFANA
jgi:hypothetical protein